MFIFWLITYFVLQLSAAGNLFPEVSVTEFYFGTLEEICR
jgi:hypothetical protein